MSLELWLQRLAPCCQVVDCHTWCRRPAAAADNPLMPTRQPEWLVYEIKLKHGIRVNSYLWLARQTQTLTIHACSLEPSSSLTMVAVGTWFTAGIVVLAVVTTVPVGLAAALAARRRRAGICGTGGLMRSQQQQQAQMP